MNPNGGDHATYHCQIFRRADPRRGSCGNCPVCACRQGRGHQDRRAAGAHRRRLGRSQEAGSHLQDVAGEGQCRRRHQCRWHKDEGPAGPVRLSVGRPARRPARGKAHHRRQGRRAVLSIRVGAHQDRRHHRGALRNPGHRLRGIVRIRVRPELRLSVRHAVAQCRPVRPDGEALPGEDADAQEARRARPRRRVPEGYGTGHFRRGEKGRPRCRLRPALRGRHHGPLGRRCRRSRRPIPTGFT